MLIIIVFLFLYSSCVYCCDTSTFTKNTNIHLQNVLTGFKTDVLINDCITLQKIQEKVHLGNELLTNIKITDENVPVLYEGAIRDLPHTSSIEFLNCKITEIKNNAFVNIPTLSSLYIHQNEITSLDNNAFNNLPIGVLSLHNNKIKFLQKGIFKPLQNMFSLNLNNNELDRFEPEWFNEQPKLTDLHISNNFIQLLKRESFVKFKLLKNINFSNNRIQYIHEDAFNGLENLKSLDVSNNRIARLEENVFKQLKNLQELWLFGNNITYISQKTLKDISSVETITIHTNPWQCGCYENIMKWARRNPVYVVSGVECLSESNPVCIVPRTNANECLEEREEDLNRLYYEAYRFENDQCSLE